MQVERIPLPVDQRGRRDEAAWLQLREPDYTASEMGALWGVGLRKSELAVYLAKAGHKVKASDPRYRRRGHVLEPVVADRLADRLPGATIRAADVYLRGRDQADPHMRVGATKDYDLERGQRRTVLEIKTLAEDWFLRHWRRGREIVPPDEVVWQVRTQAMLDDADDGLIAAQVINAREDLFLFAVPRIERHELEIQRRVSAFWERFSRGQWPRMQYGRETNALDMIPRTAAPVPPLVDDGLAELADQHARLTRAVADAERDLKAIEDKIRERMSTHAAVRLPDARLITAKSSGRRRVKIR